MTLSPEDDRAARAARRTGIVHPLDRETLVEVRGPDAARYLQAVCTRDLDRLEPGGLRYAALTDDRARYVADFWVWRAGERWWLECVAEVRDALVERLAKFAVADDVEVAVLEGYSLFHAEGPAAGEVARGLGLGSEDVGTAAGVVWARRSRYGEDGWTLAVERANAAEKLAEWKPRWSAAGLVSAPAAVQEALRLEAGRPRGGVDVTGESLLPEAGLWGAVSLDKGCFPGQEIVRRVVTRGELKRRLLGFVEAEESEGAATIEATSTAFSAARGARVGLGWIRSTGEPGTPVRVVSGANTLFAARLAALPLVPGPRSPLPDAVGEWTESTTSR